MTPRRFEDDEQDDRRRDDPGGGFPWKTVLRILAGLAVVLIVVCGGLAIMALREMKKAADAM